jgi:hypothetical protein
MRIPNVSVLILILFISVLLQSVSSVISCITGKHPVKKPRYRPPGVNTPRIRLPFRDCIRTVVNGFGRYAYRRLTRECCFRVAARVCA